MSLSAALTRGERGARHVEALRGNRSIHAALTAITAAVVGVILKLSVWFAVHTIFHSMQRQTLGLMRVDVPVRSSVDPAALLLSAVAFIAMLSFRIGMGWTLLGSAAARAAWVLSSRA